MIDVFAHIMPPAYVRDVLPHTTPATRAFAAGTRTLADLDERFRLLDRYPGLRQVLTLAGPVEAAGPYSATDVARIVNDGLADLVSRFPDRFVAAAASLPATSGEEMLAEAQRALAVPGIRGVEIFTPTAAGRPIDADEMMPLFEIMQEADLPVWVHPRRELLPDYPGEERSRYRVFGLWGWPYETTVAMTRLVMSGVFDRFPRLKVITHHCGGMVPAFHARISTWYDYMATSLKADYRKPLQRPVVEYFRLFYADTALNGNTAGLECGHAFFGASHLLLGTDMPFDCEMGDASIRDTLASVQNMRVSEADKALILSGNARSLLRLEG